MKIDFKEVFQYPFKDEKWVSKLLIGGILNFFPILNFISCGYIFQVIKNTLNREETKLPEWENFGDYFIKGLMLFLIGLIYTFIPTFILIIVCSLCARGGFIVKSLGAFLVLIAIPLFLFFIFFLPMAVIFYAKSENFAEAFRFQDMVKKIMGIFGDYLTIFIAAIICSIVGGIASAITLGILCPFIGFYLSIIFSYLFTKAYLETNS